MRLFLSAVLGCLVLLAGGLKSERELAASATVPPNVVVFLTDDMGWTDWQYDAARNPTGSKLYETPNLLQLAQESVLFNNAYSACPVCSPTRASILTGKSPGRIKMTDFVPGNGNTSNLREPSGWVRNLPASEITLAESLKSGGYSTGFIGKWHLGNSALGSDPLQHGFDTNVAGGYFGGPDAGSGGWFAGADGMWAGMPGLNTPGQYPADKYLSDALSEKVGDYIQQHANTGTPFFLANWDYQVHIPIQAPQNLVSKYQTKISTLQGQGVDLKGHVDPTYAAMVEKLDQSVGLLLNRLNDPNNDGNTSDSVRNNTIIVFSSDNGGLYDPGGEGTPTRNLPLREGKGSMYEGGIRVPEMISWTGNPNFATGTVTTQRSSSYDIYPTILDLTGLQSNQSVIRNTDIDGISIRSALEGAAFDRGNLFWHFPHRSNQDAFSATINGGSFVSAVADEDWKLIFYYEDRHYELYNLTSDIGETTNLLAYNPAIAHDLSLALQNYLTSVGALMPLCNNASSSACTTSTLNAPVALPFVLSAPAPGDYNGDSFVNAADYAVWRNNFGSTTRLAADGNRDGVVDTADYVFWRKLFLGSGSGSGIGELAAVPEPGSMLLLVIGTISAAFPVRYRRRATR